MTGKFVFSSESVTEGHPDKVADTISDRILDACLSQDLKSRVACETMVKDNLVILGGEITTQADFDYKKVVRNAIKDIGYVHSDCKFHADTFFLINALGLQSPNIAQGVDERAADGKATAEQGAGDQGLMFGFAVNETPELMPAPIAYAHRLGLALTKLRKDGTHPWLRADSKTQVSLAYEGGVPKCITAVVVSTQHSAEIKTEEIRTILKRDLIDKVLPQNLWTSKTEVHINPTGLFVVGGPEGDCGLTGRKIIVDTYGGMGRHGGGAFSGKDPSKVDRSAAYFCRWVAKNVVAAGLAQRCELQVAYAIGHPDPVSINVDTFGTNTIAVEKIEKAVSEVFSFNPAQIIPQLNLKRPIYSLTTNCAHFGRDDEALTWEQTTKVADLKRAVGI